MRSALALLPLLFVSGSLAVAVHVSVDISVPLGNEKSGAVHGPQPLPSQDAQWTLGDEYISVGVQDIFVAAQDIPVGAQFVPQTIEAAVNAWLRAGFDDTLPYVTVDGQQPEARDHFIELQRVRDSLTTYPNWKRNVRADDLFVIMQFVNLATNIFRIGTQLNLYKSHLLLAQYVTDDTMRFQYLCQEFTPVDPVTPTVHERVGAFLTDMRNHPNAVLQHIGNDITAGLALNTLQC